MFLTEIEIGFGGVGADMGDCFGGDVGTGAGTSVGRIVGDGFDVGAGSGPVDDKTEKTSTVVIAVTPIRRTMPSMREKYVQLPLVELPS
jgi:hypothetical protein